jgi:putative peptidoglycan lipid II flippase
MFGVVAILTVASKVVGLLRDMVVASAYGTGVVADAFNYATLLTGNVLVLFGGLGGPFHSSTVAIVTPKRDDRSAGLLLSQILAITIVILTAITIVVYFFAPHLATLMSEHYVPKLPLSAHSIAGQAAIEAMNNANLQRRELFHDQFLIQLELMLPLIVIAGIVGVSYGVLNVYHKIFWPSLSPAIASIAIIAAILLTDPSKRLVDGWPLALGSLLGAIGQMVAQIPSMMRLPLDWRLKLKPQAGLSEYSEMLWPATISTSVGQLTVYVDSIFAFMLKEQGAWTAVVQSNRLVQLPLGILLTAMLVPILPRFTEHASAKKPEAVKSELRRALGILWFLSLPMTAILLVISRPIVEVLFQRGNFDARSTALVTTALVYLAPSIVFYVARDLMTRVYYAYQDSSTPYKIAMIAILVKAPLDWALISMMNSVAAISLATSFMTVFNLTLLTVGLKRKIGDLGLTQMVKPLIVMLVAGVACALVTAGSYAGGEHIVSMHNPFIKLIAIGVSSVLGLLVYTILCVAGKLEEPLMMARRVPVLRNYVIPETEMKNDQ